MDELTISQHLANRLRQRGVECGFGIAEALCHDLHHLFMKVGSTTLVLIRVQGARPVGHAAQLQQHDLPLVTKALDGFLQF